jgi:hypothetical protein
MDDSAAEFTKRRRLLDLAAKYNHKLLSPFTGLVQYQNTG